MDEQTALTPQQSFEGKMKDRIREDVGDLMPDEVLTAMLQKVLQEAFFERQIETNEWGRIDSDKPPVIAEMVIELMQDRVKKAVIEWLKEHEQEVKDLIEKVLEEGFAKAAINGINSVVSGPLSGFVTAVNDRFQQLGQSPI